MVRVPEPKVPFIPVTGLCKIQCFGHNNGTPWANIFYGIKSPAAAYTSGELNQVATQASSLYGSNMQAPKTTADIFEQVVVTDLSNSFGLSNTVNSAVHGTNASGPLPSSNAWCISWQISQRYRGGKPRTYLSGPSIGDMAVASANQFGNSSVTAVEAAADAFRIGINAIVPGIGESLAMTAVHKLRNHLVLTPPQLDFIIGDRVDKRVCGQSRRLGKALFPSAE